MSKNIIITVSIAIVIGLVIFVVKIKTQPGPPSVVSKAEQAVINRVSTPEFGDLKQIKERRLLRVLVQYSKTNFFFDGPEFKGFDFEIMREYEKFLNKNAKDESDKIVLTFIVKPFANILQDLIDGHGDIAIANFTITPERARKINFTDPYILDVNEVVVQHKSVSDLNSVDQLSSKSLYLLAESSFIQHIDILNKQFKQNNLDPVSIIKAANDLDTADILELVNANVYPLTIADDFTAKTWASILPDIVVRDDLTINKGGQIAWAVRKDSNVLRKSLNEFISSIRRGTLLGNIFFKRYYENSEWIDNPTSSESASRMDKYKAIFQKYARQYNFDWLSIAAMAYQESKLDQTRISSAGAVGIMQIKPKTATSEAVDIPDIDISENNIHAGIKYLAYLREHYFTTPDIAPEDQINFSWAAYNAGPVRINKLRSMASELGYDANKWFSNVERVAAREIGRETVRYVANVNKYYIAYKLAENNFR